MAKASASSPTYKNARELAMETLGFFIFLSVVWYCDHKQFLEGYNAWFFKAKTDEEKKLREKKVNKN